jgi:hypothetical protein
MEEEPILLWVLMTYGRRRREYSMLSRKAEHSHLYVHRLPSPPAASRFLSSLPAQ